MTTQNATQKATDAAAASAAAPQTPAAAATAAAPAAVVETDDFAAAFDEAVNEDVKPKPGAAAAAGKSADDAAASEAAARESAVAAAEVAATGAAAPAAAAAAAATTETTATDPDELTKLRARNAELEAKLKAPPAKEPDTKPAATEDKPAAAAADADIKWYTPNEQEAATLADFDKQWPEVAAAITVRNKADIYNCVQYVFSQLHKTYGPKFAHMDEVVDEMETALTLGELRNAHKDYDNVREKVVEWAETLPGPFKKAAKATLESGTPEDVSQLIEEYKKTHPAAAAVTPPAAATTAVPATQRTELSAAAKKAANALSAVDSKRTAQATAVDPNDFSGAWDEATASSK